MVEVLVLIHASLRIDAWLSSWGPSYEKDELLRHWTLGPAVSAISTGRCGRYVSMLGSRGSDETYRCQEPLVASCY